MKRVIKPEQLPFSRWSRLSAAMSRLSPDERLDRLEVEEIDEDAYARAEQIHLRTIARAVSAGDDTYAEEHSRNVQAALDGSLDDAVGLVVTLDGPAPTTASTVLPFSAGTFVPEPIVGSSRDVDPAGETLPIAGVKEDTLPFAEAGELRFLKLSTFAALSAELRAAPQRRDEVLASHRLSSAGFLQLAQLWAKRFEETPDLRTTFEALVQKQTKEHPR